MSNERKRIIWDRNEDEERWILTQTGIFFDESEPSDDETEQSN